MKAKDLAAILLQSPDMGVSIWDAFHDCQSPDVKISELGGCIHIDCTLFGPEILEKKD